MVLAVTLDRVTRALHATEAGDRDRRFALLILTELERDLLDQLDASSEKQGDYAERVHRAIVLAPTLDLCRALLAGEAVPLDSLDQDAVRRYGLRSDTR